jgi:hypothetical protein
MRKCDWLAQWGCGMPFFSDGGLPSDALFSGRDLRTLFEEQQSKAQTTIEEIDADYLLATPTDDLVEMVTSPLLIDVPVLSEGAIFQDQPKEISREVKDYGRIIRVKGFLYKITIPFDGHLGLFRHTPILQISNPPRAKAYDEGIIFELAGYDLTADDIKNELDKRISEIKRHLASQEAMVVPFNTKLETDVRTAIEARKKRILEARNISAALGYPMQRRQNDPMTHIATGVRRRIAPRAPTPGVRAPFAPEPVLAEAEYQHILGILELMTDVMERSPSAFARFEEEHLRDFYLVALNGHYEGNATGETFNAAGKTDILIRENGKNIFIAECKYWRGEKSLVDGINQLLSYLSWRDTKASLIVFNRNRDFSAVLGKIKQAADEHPQKKKGPEVQNETRFRCVFRSPLDDSREIIITIMAFDIPAQEKMQKFEGGENEK